MTAITETTMISEMKMAGGRKLIHDVHNHMFRNHKNNITNCNNNKYLHIQQSDTEDGDINGNETMIHSHNIRITENPLPPPPANAASEDYIR